MGSIPAWAGKPPAHIDFAAPDAVYPRVGGETPTSCAAAAISRGLSPRGRGNLIALFPADLVARSIPAWAGKPGQSDSSATSSRVYPRVGGGTRRNKPIHGNFTRVYPRVGGETSAS